ncbi:hypothetical protein SAY87_021461 [Trapa incisa]|uniref:Protein OBERON 4 n=1 Tax=Trapa incisa TaxID=236973 RepID=A0AAN7JX50_9MYRT|nr:hypothetical protein SAY87_021461 [Trapa incisa]
MMKRLRSTDDLDSFGDKGSNRSSSSRHSFYYNKPSEALHKGLPASSSRFDRDRLVDDDGRKMPRSSRKRPGHDLDSSDRRKGLGFDRYSERKSYGSDFSERDGYNGYRGSIHRSESFSDSKREFPKGYRSQRDRSRHEGSVSTSSWQRIGNLGRDSDESRGVRGGCMEDRERKGLREVKSPSRSKDSGSDLSRKGCRDGKAREFEKSPSMSRGDSGYELLSKPRSQSNILTDRRNKEKERSPSCSSVRSMSVDAKKNEDVQALCGNTSEMEEGELDPEAKLGPDTVAEAGVGDGAGHSIAVESDAKNPRCDEMMETTKDVENSSKSHAEDDSSSMDSAQRGEKKEEKDLAYQSKNIGSSSTPSGSSCGSGDEAYCEIVKNEEIVKIKDVVSYAGPKEYAQEKNGHIAVEVEGQMDVECNEEKHIDPVGKAVDMATLNSSKEAQQEAVMPEAISKLASEGPTLSFLDKGKGIASASTAYIQPNEVGAFIKDESMDTAMNKQKLLEGPSIRGFELFSGSPVQDLEKSNWSNKSTNRKRVLEPLDLSLSLPNILLPIGAPESGAPASPSQGKSLQSWSSFPSNSDAFTVSTSFSGSQSFFHNPSCSLTQNEMDFEKSVGSRPIFGGVDWEALAANESKHKETILYSSTEKIVNGSAHPSQGDHRSSSGQLMHDQNQNLILSGESSKTPKGLDRQLTFQKQVPGLLKIHDEAKLPAQSIGSHEIGSSYSFKQKLAMTQENNVCELYINAGLKDGEHTQFVGVALLEAILGKMVSEPISEMAKKFQEMGGDVVRVKEHVCDFMLNPEKHGQRQVIQKALQDRSDITLESLLNAHRTQLEILVAVKTGLPDFLQPPSGTSSSDLADIFLNFKCKNLACGSALPVNECDCKVCGLRTGFCSECMCLVCSKFDMATNTCKWVGCDVCLHWCHVDCALRESFIRNGQSATGAQGAIEMQFHCVACGHPSEMFGFVKDVFQNFAREWTTDNLYRELEYVKRVFCGSKDVRGRRLFEIADQILPRLANKANLPEIYSCIMRFFTDSDSSKVGNIAISFPDPGRVGNGVVGAKREMPWIKSVYSEKTSLMKHDNSLLPNSNNRNDKLTIASDLQRGSEKPVFDELDSIIRIKQAEVHMFQSRADDARREAEGLKRIAMAKSEKIEEEYTARVAKLYLAEAEVTRKHKFEELQALEKAHLEYFNMKVRMEADIKDLLLKMESTKRNSSI